MWQWIIVPQHSPSTIVCNSNMSSWLSMNLCGRQMTLKSRFDIFEKLHWSYTAERRSLETPQELLRQRGDKIKTEREPSEWEGKGVGVGRCRVWNTARLTDEVPLFLLCCYSVQAHTCIYNPSLTTGYIVLLSLCKPQFLHNISPLILQSWEILHYLINVPCSIQYWTQVFPLIKILSPLIYSMCNK